MPRKFSVGDKARIAPERIPGYYAPNVRVGRVVTVVAVKPAAYRHGKCTYMVGRSTWLRSDDLRPVDAPKLAAEPGPGERGRDDDHHRPPEGRGRCCRVYGSVY